MKPEAVGDAATDTGAEPLTRPAESSEGTNREVDADRTFGHSEVRSSEPAAADETVWRRADWQPEPYPSNYPAAYSASGAVTSGNAAGSSYPDHELSSEDEPDEEEWEYSDGALFAAIFSAPSLALAAFVFALTGLLGGMIPESLPYLVQIDPGNGPAYHVRIVGMIALGFAIVAASLGLAAMLRSVGSPLRWPTYLGGAAVLLAILIALQSILLILLAGAAEPPGPAN